MLAVVGSIITGTPPSRTDSPAEIASYYFDNDTEIQLAAFLTALGVIALWLEYLWTHGAWWAFTYARGLVFA